MPDLVLFEGADVGTTFPKGEVERSLQFVKASVPGRTESRLLCSRFIVITGMNHGTVRPTRPGRNFRSLVQHRDAHRIRRKLPGQRRPYDAGSDDDHIEEPLNHFHRPHF